MRPQCFFKACRIPILVHFALLQNATLTKLVWNLTFRALAPSPSQAWTPDWCPVSNALARCQLFAVMESGGCFSSRLCLPPFLTEAFHFTGKEENELRQQPRPFKSCRQSFFILIFCASNNAQKRGGAKATLEQRVFQQAVLLQAQINEMIHQTPSHFTSHYRT